jgi:DNA-binding NarL/FixJ family response regulator
MQIVPVVIIGRRELLREGIAALLQDSPYEVVASAASASQLKAVGDLARRRGMVILAIEDEDARIVETTKSIKVLRSTFPDSKLVVVAQMQGRWMCSKWLQWPPTGTSPMLAPAKFCLTFWSLLCPIRRSLLQRHCSSL